MDRPARDQGRGHRRRARPLAASPGIAVVCVTSYIAAPACTAALPGSLPHARQYKAPLSASLFPAVGCAIADTWLGNSIATALSLLTGAGVRASMQRTLLYLW